jgi:hypothetical protein
VPTSIGASKRSRSDRKLGERAIVVAKTAVVAVAEHEVRLGEAGVETYRRLRGGAHEREALRRPIRIRPVDLAVRLRQPRERRVQHDGPLVHGKRTRP